MHADAMLMRCFRRHCFLQRAAARMDQAGAKRKCKPDVGIQAESTIEFHGLELAATLALEGAGARHEPSHCEGWC